MSMMQIRGTQIKDHQIKDVHIDGKLTEAVLDIKFSDHAAEIFEQKPIVDYVQRDKVTVLSGTSSLQFTNKTPNAATATAKGIVTEQYEVRVREAATGEPAVVLVGGEKVYVFGALSFVSVSESNYTYKVDFKATKGDGTVVEAIFDKDTALNILYPQRFSLHDVSETFAANERFVDAAADTTAYLNIQQLAKEIFGTSYKINNTGEISNAFGNGKTFAENFSIETHGLTNTTLSAKEVIDEVFAARSGKSSLSERLIGIETAQSEALNTYKSALLSEEAAKGASLIHIRKGSDIFNGLSFADGTADMQTVLDALYNKMVTEDTAIKTNLASTDASKGAALVGVADAGNVFASTNVETVLKELYDKIVSDVTAEAEARTQDVNALKGRAGALETEVGAARGSMTTVKERLDVSLALDGQLKDYTMFHKHHKLDTQLGENATSVLFQFTGADQFSRPKVTDTYTLEVNGMTQVFGVHYNVAVNTDNNTVAITLVDTTLFVGDYVTLNASIFAVPQK